MKRFLALVLTMLMIVSIIPMSAMAATVDFDLSKSSDDYYSVVEKNDYVLAPGATETELVLNNAKGDHRNVVHAVEVDLKNENISLYIIIARTVPKQKPPKIDGFIFMFSHI